MVDNSANVPVVAKGRYLYRGYDRFLVKGVVYQGHEPGDVVSDDCFPQLQQDVALFKELGINTLHIYMIDPEKPHGRCMKLLEDAGIYVYLSITSLPCTINRMKPYESYISTTMRTFFDVVDCIAAFPNTIGFSIANSLVNDDDYMLVAPVLKAVIRDVKRYMRLNHELTGQRILFVGYSAAMSNEREKTLLEYLMSGDGSSSLDIWTCVNFFTDSNLDKVRAEYDDMATRFRDFAIPMFISEYGGYVRRPRQFRETEVMYSPAFTEVFSGGCVYEFLLCPNDYGLVESFGSGDTSRSEMRRITLARAEDPNFVAERRSLEGRSLIILHDFVNYKAALAAVDMTAAGHSVPPGGIGESRAIETVRTSWPWDPQYTEPATCVDWEDVERALRAITSATA